MDRATSNLNRAGELFMYTVWLQCQMADLIILQSEPDLIPDFVSDRMVVPQGMAERRISYWEKMFKSVKCEFVEQFYDILTTRDIDDLEAIYRTRNMIAHAHLSLGRDYMLYRPSGGQRKEQAIVNALGVVPREGQTEPMLLKMQFWKDDVYLGFFKLIKRFDEECLERVSASVGIPHSRIR